MINHLSGTLNERGRDHVVIECGGIGFRVAVTSATLDGLPPGSPSVTILTHLQMREGGGELYGFSSEEEREIFHALTGVAGVGPRSGMAVLSVLGAGGVITGAMRGDAKLFSSVPGIGKKLAQRMIAELPDRLKKITLSGNGRGEAPHASFVEDSTAISEAVEALVSLGFPRADSHNAVILAGKSDSPEVPDSGFLIKVALAHLYSNARPGNR